MKLSGNNDYQQAVYHLTIVCQDFRDRWVNDTTLNEKHTARVRVIYFFLSKALKQLQAIDDDFYELTSSPHDQGLVDL